ncbi:hypothetical protein ACFXTI_014495 [Malus domestica]
MEFAVPPEFNLTPGGPPLWVSLAEKGYYGFKPTVCALCYSMTHDILQCPERKYFADYVQEYIYMRNNSKWNWNNPHSEFYTQSLKEHLGQYFERLNVPQDLSVEDKLSKLLESTELYIEITNQGFQIQAVNRGRSYDDQEVGAGTEEPSAYYSRPEEETAPDDLEISIESAPTKVCVPLMHSPETPRQPAKQQECMNTLTNLITGQLLTDQKILTAVTDSAPAQPIKFKEMPDESCKQAKIYVEKRKLIDSQVPRRKFQPVRKLWVLNTRFKSARWRNKHSWKGTYTFTKIHSKRKAYKKNSTIKFGSTVLYDVIKEWLTLKERVAFRTDSA